MRVEISDEEVVIYDDDLSELVKWTKDEWIQDASVPQSIWGAITLVQDRPDELRRILRRQDGRAINGIINFPGDSVAKG